MTNRLLRCSLLFPTVALIAACASTPRATRVEALQTDRQQASYVVGLDQARELAPLMQELDIELVIQALRTVHAGETPLLDAAQADAVRARFTAQLRAQRDAEQRALAAANRAAGAAFLASNAQADGVVTTASGLQYRELRAGDGAKPAPHDTVRIDYAGTLLDGQTFESTYATDHPAEIVLERVMPGLTEGIGLMPVGAKFRFWLPPELAYGERGAQGPIGPNAVLVFEVELLAIAGAAQEAP